ncbi:MAG: glutathione peroxidase [Flavobacterium sp.]|uniref:glutathione peroxidase n=1 Tax=Flavobacterium sp. TaxID=239 RepID=UPI0026213044|nr:glutathione peroxidase [Flavobacterium sp.]MDD5150822.1 glutathione peroxidase [Flavobacterium sp.]
MKKVFNIACGIFLLVTIQSQAQNKSAMEKQTIYQFKVEDLSGKIFDFASLKGKKIMIVNTASKCGYTPQYKELEALYKEYADKGFVIVGFPANNFGAQEPGTNEEIATFCQLNYGVTFPMMSKISVKGKDMNEVYQFLTEKSKNGLQDSDVKWNFQKYLINENGELVKIYYSKTVPNDAEIVNWIKG